MCFHCDNGNPQHHIPSEYRKITVSLTNKPTCECGYNITERQADGTSPHYCRGKYILISRHEDGEIACEAPHSFGVWILGKFHRVSLGKLGEIILELQEWKQSAIEHSLDQQKIGEALNMRIGEGVSTGAVLVAIDKLKTEANRPQFGVSCVCKWEKGKVVSMCGAHHAVVHKVVEEWKLDAMNGLFKIVPTSCRCGGSYAWVQINENGAEVMMGCVCHTVIVKKD